MNDNLTEYCVNILEKKVNIRRLWKEGFRRDPLKYYFIITYPPITLAKRISEQEVYSNFSVDTKKIALYFHIPFCSRKCVFCPYFSIVPNKDQQLGEYLEYLKKEIRIIKRYIPNNLKVEAVYIGGGTPTILKPQLLNDLLGYIHKEFRLSESVEITVEVHPEIVRTDVKTYLQILKENKVNRISIGMQTFDNNILSLTQRGHTAEESIKLFNEVKKTGFPCVVIDILYGLPDQTIDSWLEDLKVAYDLAPDVVTTYCMEIRDWTKNYQWYVKEPYRFPNEYLYHLFYIMGVEKAKQEGYIQKPVMYYSKVKNHFKYATDIFAESEENIVIGLGISAYSWVNGYQYFNYHTFEDYYKTIREGNLPIWKGIKLSLEDRMARMAMLNLRLSSCINKKKFRLAFGRDVCDVFDKTITRLKGLGLLQETNHEISLTYSGTLFTEEVCILFIPPTTKNNLKGLKGKYDRFYRL
ncbi:MAG: coproporphyrinogen III oxidase family protein [Acidobacteria bacterium]|nr:coproporphyrinogen III oxidase family protein [Acidobacteriota bacterium]MBU4307343.1 coproporphyrinogen III oxidase family protein [Acidobacteriota bacterium]MCG2810500.1 coproporphyrinogen III oxidase family protein [Candidatus Aminicenantes bacterium]MCG2821720.1 coproporphyrinogen III oxidase family protein [Candidatus Atribacteria bacterium]